MYSKSADVKKGWKREKCADPSPRWHKESCETPSSLTTRLMAWSLIQVPWRLDSWPPSSMKIWIGVDVASVALFARNMLLLLPLFVLFLFLFRGVEAGTAARHSVCDYVLGSRSLVCDGYLDL